MKSGKFDTPIDFNPSLTIKGYHICYDNLMEVAQGSPRIGRLSINNDMIPYYSFGGPFLYSDSYIYVPAFIKSTFILTRINLNSHSLNFIGNSSDIISVEKLENNKLYYYDSLDQIQLKVYDLSPYTISNATDTPACFSSKFMMNDYSLEYHDIETVGKKAQIGRIIVNGKSIDSHKFGSPFLYNDTQILIPVFVKGFFRSGFKLALINLNDLSINIVGDKENLISLISFENCNKIIYYTDLDKKIRKSVMI